MKTSIIDRFLFIFFSIQFIFYFILFDDIYLILGLGLNSLIILFCVRIVNYKITHPLFIGAVFFYVTFNLPVLYYAGVNQIDASGVISFFFNQDEPLFTKSVWVINIALIGYVFGNFKVIKEKKGIKINNKYISKLQVFGRQ